MSKRYLGLICLLYSGIFGYVVIFDKLKLFLAPQMQIYIKLSLIPLLIIGLVMLFNNKVHYKFKISDLVLILPLILLIFAGDGRLTSSFASNRTTNLNTENRTKSVEKVEDKKDEEIIELPKSEEQIEEVKEEPKEEITETYDFSNVDFEIIDANYSELSNYITFAPKADKFKGQTIRVRGIALKKASYIPDGYFAIGKYAISCCAADAGFTGFIAKYDNSKITEDKWYEVEGILEKGKDKDGYDIMYINVINIKEISSKGEEQYVYPCYAYDDGSCEAMSKYDLEY